MKIKSERLKLKPSLRERRHYLVVKVQGIEKNEIKNSIDGKILKFIGTLGYACAGIQYIKIVEKNKIYFVVLSVLTKYVDYVKSALALEKDKMKCVGVSGTLKKASRFLK